MTDKYLEFGIKHLKQKHFEKALDYFNEFKQKYPENGAVYYYLGNLYYIQGNLTKAHVNYNTAINLNFRLKECYMKMGIIYRKIGCIGIAEKVIDNALSIDPLSYISHYIKGKINYNLHIYKTAIVHFEKSIQLNNNIGFKEAYQRIILSYAKLNQREIAFQKFKEYFRNDKKKPETKAFKAQLHKEFGEYLKSINYINKALKEKPNEAIYQGDRVVYLYYVHSFDQCIKEGEHIIEERRTGPKGLKSFYSLLFYVGCSYLRKDEKQMAEKYFKEYEECVKEEKWLIEYLVEKARMIINTLPEKALEYIDKVLKEKPLCVQALKFKLYCYELNYWVENRIERIDIEKRLAFLKQQNNEELNDEVYDNTVDKSDLVDSFECIKIDGELEEKKKKIQVLTQDEDELDCDFKCIGKGSFGKVYSVRMYTGETVVLKRFKSNEITLDAKEKDILQAIDHPNIVKYLGFYKKDIQMELCNGGDLFTLVIKKKISLPLKFKYKIIRQVTEALDFLHNTKGMVHGDIKTKNILLDKPYEISQKTVDEFPNAKLGDFGLSKIIFSKDNKNRGESLAYASPEVVNGEELTFKSDIYSFGITIYELFQEKIPYYNLNRDIIEDRIKNGITPNFDRITNLPKELIQLMKNCCKANPEQRDSIKDILNSISLIQYQSM